MIQCAYAICMFPQKLKQISQKMRPQWSKQIFATSRRHDVVTSWKFVWPLWAHFLTDSLQIWWKHVYGIDASYHVKKTSWRNNVATLWRHNVFFGGFLAPVAMIFDRFTSNLVETCIWHRRFVSCKNERHDVTTSRRYDVKTSFWRFFGPCSHVFRPICFRYDGNMHMA